MHTSAALLYWTLMLDLSTTLYIMQYVRRRRTSCVTSYLSSAIDFYQAPDRLPQKTKKKLFITFVVGLIVLKW
ncbi:hypothetical protein BDZ89DRAFT_147791 [Hymenopellis radicata]|nr:hypothetical protein BDZ89DRAFT_147791 [Hymenopellis radicata]